MSINFQNDMGSEAQDFIKEMFEVEAIDSKTALLKEMQIVQQKQFSELARKAKQPVTLEVNEIGDRKEVGGVVYQLDELGWQRMPIGTTL